MCLVDMEVYERLQVVAVSNNNNNAPEPLISGVLTGPLLLLDSQCSENDGAGST